MNEIRTLKNQKEIEMAYKLCNTVFFKCESFFERRYPHVFNECNIDNLFGAFYKGQLVSFIATYPTKIDFLNLTLNTRMLGAVCTYKDFQGNGFSTSILNYIEKELSNKTDLLVISGDGKNYLKFGAMIVGQIYEVHVPKEKLNVTQLEYKIIEHIEELEVEKYYNAYELKTLPKFFRTLDETKKMIQGHLEPLNNEHNYVIHDLNYQSFSCIRIGFEGDIKIAYVIESVGNSKLIIDMIEDFAVKNDCDKLFYRTTEIVKKHQDYTFSTPITGTMKVINPNLKLSALDIFGDLNKRGHYPCIRVDDLNFL